MTTRRGSNRLQLRRIGYLCFIVALLPILVLASTPARADLIWSWSFDHTHYEVGPTDSIVVDATLFNDSSSTENLQTNGISASFTGDLQKTYNFTFGPTGNSSDFGLEFVGLDLAPGDAFPFVWGILTPLGGNAKPGVYPALPEAHLILFPPGFESGVSQKPTNSFDVQVIAEPASFVLVISGLLSLIFIGRYRLF